MSSLRFLSADALPGFLKTLCDSYKVLAPTRQGKAVVFAPYTPGDEICMDKATVSPKAAVLPPCETLMSYQREKAEEGGLRLALDDPKQAEATALFACRPCDARGVAVLDRPFTKGPYQDPYYQARRDLLLVITRACNSPCATCFCHWVGSHPHDDAGSDILMIDVADVMGQPGYVLRAVTPKGQSVLDASGLTDATAQQDSVQQAAEAAKALQKPAPDISAARTKLASLFTDMDFWQNNTAHCLSCGGCTYFCPACYCFNITDEGDGMGIEGKPGQRLRTWDTCMASHFTREASGHNSRTLKAQRMRNRVSHKFSNYPTVWKGEYSCTGCGRCITQCPVHLDIRAIVLAALEA